MRMLPAVLIVLGAVPAWASPSTSAPAANTPEPSAQAAPAPSPAPADPQSTSPYAYSADGRRDPFQSLTSKPGAAKGAPRPTTPGIAGIRIDELSVRGIMQSRERLVAMVQGPDNRTYLIHQGDKLADGVVKTITPQGLVLVQDVSDPRAKDKTREVRKPLRSAEDEKE
jgi:Tfp pilus assembly protein PilP